jgi:hypothetical protein
MPRFWPRLPALFAAGCLLGLTGLPLALTQAWGWATMFASYVETMPTPEALRFTFSGQELCGYCTFVEEAKETERNATLQMPPETRLLVPVASSIKVSPTAGGDWMRPGGETEPGRPLEPPPSPPPRV